MTGRGLHYNETKKKMKNMQFGKKQNRKQKSRMKQRADLGKGHFKKLLHSLIEVGLESPTKSALLENMFIQKVANVKQNQRYTPVLHLQPLK